MDFYQEARHHVVATVAPPFHVADKSGDTRRQLMVMSDCYGGDEDSGRITFVTNGMTAGTARTALQYAEHVNPSAQYQSSLHNLYSRSNGK